MVMYRVLGIYGGKNDIITPNYAIKIIKSLKTESDLLNTLSEISSGKKLSNSEGALLAALYGAHQEGSDISLISLKKLFSSKQKVDSDVLKKLQKIISKSDGVCMSSPVYFGNSSSNVSKFIGSININQDIENTFFCGKIVGYMSAGARWNGGQMASNIFGLYDCLQQGALVVGDGPPSSQAGGMIRGRHVGDIINDKDGLETCIKTGRRITQAVKIIKSKEYEHTVCLVNLIVTDFIPKYIISKLEDKISRLSNIHYDTIYLSRYKINNDKVCTKCPSNINESYGCIIDDDMKEIHKKLLTADGIIVSGYFSLNNNRLETFQTFIERTRYLRRDDYRLSNIPITVLQFEQIGTNNIFFIRCLPSFLKHNVIITGPTFIGYESPNGDLNSRFKLSEVLNKFIRYVKKIKNGRINFPAATKYKEK